MKINDANIKALAKKMKISEKKIPLSQFKNGIKTELEHKDVTGGDLVKTAKIAMAHLNEDVRYYKALKHMEKRLEGKSKGYRKSRKNSCSKREKVKKAVSKGISKGKKGQKKD